MSVFRYEALQTDGLRSKGVVNADSLENAKEVLRKQRVLVLSISPEKESSKKQTVPSSLRIDFTRNLSQLLRAGLPLYESLLTIEEKYRQHKYHVFFASIADRVSHGIRLSKALEEFPGMFDQLYVAMVAAGEESGTLPATLVQLEILLSRVNKAKKQLVSALIYPLFLLGFCLVIVYALFFFMIPSMAVLFEGRALHPLTAQVVAMSQYLTSHQIEMFLVIFGSIFGLILFFRHPLGKKGVLQLGMKLCFVRRILTAAVLSRFCRSLAVLLGSTVSLVEALRFSRRTMKNPLFEEVIEKAENEVLKGGKLSHELSRSPWIPPMMTRMLAIGEESGAPSQMLKEVADLYEEELEKGLSRLTSMIQPVMLFFLAMVIGLVVLSVLLPLTDVGSFIGE